MKKKNASNNKFNGLYLSLLLLVCCAGSVPAQDDKIRTIEKTFDGKTALWASHRYGDLVLKKGTGSQIKAVLTISASAKNDEDLQLFLSRFELTASEAPDNKIDLKTDDIIKNWKTVNGRTTIKFNDGQSFSGIQNFRMTLEIFVPKLRYATLENKYAAIKAEEGTAATLEIKMYDGAVDAPGQFENLVLDLKYGRGSAGHFSNCNAVLYDYDLTLGNGGALTMESKYSGLQIGNLQSLKLDCFDDDYRIGGVSGFTDIQDKYSEFNFSGNLGDASFRLYDSKVEAKNGDNIRVPESKYTEFSFQELNSLQFDSSFDDKVQVVKVGALSAGESKYTEFTADGLWKSLNFPASFDDDIRVRNVGGSFESLIFNGKYTDITLPIPATVKYEIDAELKYGKLIYPESGMETSVYKEKDDEIIVKARVKGASENAPKLNIKSYDGAIRLE